MLRPLLAVLVLAGTLAAPAATAAPRPPCGLVNDPAGDGTPASETVALPAGSDDALDVIGGDVATGPHNVVVAIRVGSLTPGALTSRGVAYQFSWFVDGLPHYVQHFVAQDGTRWATFHVSGGADVPVATKTDPATSTITVTVPRRADPSLARRRVTLTKLFLDSRYGVVVDGGTNETTGGDTATTLKTYVDGTPSCLKGT
jgi:hypothetical protein